MTTTFSTCRRPVAAVALATAAATLVLSACAPGGGGSSASKNPTAPVSTAVDTAKKVTITVADAWGKTGTGATFGNVITNFEKKYPNITVKRQTTDYASYQQSINIRGSSPNPPDVMMLETSGYGQGFYQFVRSGVVLPLDSYAKAYNWSSRFGAASNLDVFRFDHANHNQWGSGSLYGVPEQNAMIAVFCNEKLMRQAGITSNPKTMAEFEHGLAAAKAKGITPIAQSNTYIHLQMALADSFASNATDVNNWIYGRSGATFASSANQKAASKIRQWQQAGYFEKGVSGETDANAAGLFLSGKAMYYVEGSWMAGATESSFKSDGSAFQLPGTTAGAAAPVGGGFSTPLAISAKSKHPDVAAAFINYFISQQNSDYLFHNGWGLPGASLSPSAAAEKSLTNSVLSILTPIEATGGAGTTPFLDWAAPTFTNQLPQYLQDMASGHASTTKFTSTVQQDWSSFQQQRKNG